MRRRFLRRIALGVVLVVVLISLGTTFLVQLVSHSVEPAIAVAPLLVVVLLTVAIAARSVRKLVVPVSDVMDAADRVAGGDYSVRLRERGNPEMRRLARSFNAMTERLESSEELRRNLLADVAHELRTPLSVIRGNAEGILDGLYAPDRDHLEPLLEETAVMARLLEDLQTLSTAEAGVLRLHREPVSPADLVDDAVGAFRTQADARRVRLEARVPSGLELLEIDRVRVGEVLANLIGTALRHTPAGGTVALSAERATGGTAFAVTDSGSGISASDLPSVFDRFVKASDSGGAGLGLAIAKALVEAHGGTISAESEPGRGTTIRFVIP